MRSWGFSDTISQAGWIKGSDVCVGVTGADCVKDDYKVKVNYIDSDCKGTNCIYNYKIVSIQKQTTTDELQNLAIWPGCVKPPQKRFDFSCFCMR